MNKFIFCTLGLFLLSCNENTNTVNNTEPNSEVQSVNQGQPTKDEPANKSDAELAMEAANLAIKATKDIVRQKQIRDSIYLANRKSYYAYQIGLSMRKSDAIELYKKLVDAGITSLRIFRVSRKENYVVKFEGKPEETLLLGLGDLKTQLGDIGNGVLEVINLTDEKFCSKKEILRDIVETEDDIEIKYIICE